MIIWLRIDGDTPRQIYADARALAHLDTSTARHELLQRLGILRTGVDGEASNISVTLHNEAGQCSRLFAQPPLGARAQLMTADEVLFSGAVESISLDSTTCSVGIEW